MRYSWRLVVSFILGIVLFGAAVWLGIQLAFPKHSPRVTVEGTSSGLLSRLLGETDQAAEGRTYRVDEKTGLIRVRQTGINGQTHEYEVWHTDKGWVAREVEEE